MPSIPTQSPITWLGLLLLVLGLFLVLEGSDIVTVPWLTVGRKRAAQILGFAMLVFGVGIVVVDNRSVLFPSSPTPTTTAVVVMPTNAPMVNTPDSTGTIRAIADATFAGQTALAQTFIPTIIPTDTSTHVFTPTVAFTSTGVPTWTLAAGNTPIQTVTANNQWTARIQPFNGVPMVLVPPGCFMMGSDPAKDSQAQSDEQPQTKICFQQPLWIDQTPVTQGQFQQFNGQAASGSFFTGTKRPVERITWFEAKAYCEQQRSGRLPTEAEYEYAARGLDDLVYPWGNTFVDADVVYYANSGNQIADVGSKPGGKSWVGALDMTGNIWEWTSSIYKPYPYDPTDGRVNDSDAHSVRVVRGGSWYLNSDFVRAAVRYSDVPSVVLVNFGFRCVRAY